MVTDADAEGALIWAPDNWGFQVDAGQLFWCMAHRTFFKVMTSSRGPQDTKPELAECQASTPHRCHCRAKDVLGFQLCPHPHPRQSWVWQAFPSALCGNSHAQQCASLGWRAMATHTVIPFLAIMFRFRKEFQDIYNSSCWVRAPALTPVLLRLLLSPGMLLHQPLAGAIDGWLSMSSLCALYFSGHVIQL